jgi:subtilisin family serine protease
MTRMINCIPTRSLTRCLWALLLAASLLASPLAHARPAAPAHPYLEPGLAAAGSADLSLIVTAGDSAAAARAVRQLGGLVTADLWLIDAVAATLPAGQLSRLAGAPGVVSIVQDKPVSTSGKPKPSSTSGTTDSTTSTSSTTSADLSPSLADPMAADGWVTPAYLRFPVPWDGTPDVQPTSSWNTWKFVYPLAIDTGSYSVSQSGTGIGVAVVDSGVYFDATLKNELGNTTLRRFLGQADFIDRLCSTSVTSRGATITYGQQYTDHCFTDYEASKDPYGHGTHVAGIIWSSLTDQVTGVTLGVAWTAKILGVRILGPDGTGSYARVIEGIQYVVANRERFNIRVLNLSLSANQTTPYFVDPLNRAVEQAWQAGIVVVAAAGNTGPAAETITVPGNDPYVITVGALDGRRTPGYWKDDFIPSWSASGPTLDGFLKPDLVAPGAQIVSFMHNDYTSPANTAALVQQHPDYSLTGSLFRMSGTSMATAVVSGAAALMLEKNPALTPGQVKYRLMATAKQMKSADGQPAVSPLLQGAGRLWVPQAVNADLPLADANQGMNLAADLAAGWGSIDASGNPVLDAAQLAQHYAGPVRKALSDDGQVALYYLKGSDGSRVVLGLAEAASRQWLLPSQLAEGLTWTVGNLVWSGGNLVWSGGNLVWSGIGPLFDASGNLVWSGGNLVWSGSGLFDASGNLVWSGGDLFDASGNLVWSGGNLVWSGGNLVWSGGNLVWSGGNLVWSGASALFDASGNLVWSGGNLVWSGSGLLDASGNLVWSGGDLFDASGNLVWSGGNLVWSGGSLVWSGGNLVWSGGNLVWSGGLLVSSSGASYDPQVYQPWAESAGLVWSGGNLVWSGGNLVWSGANLVWSASLAWTQPLDPAAATLGATCWVDW